MTNAPRQLVGVWNPSHAADAMDEALSPEDVPVNEDHEALRHLDQTSRSTRRMP
jgi:hypothetical protein